MGAAGCVIIKGLADWPVLPRAGAEKKGVEALKRVSLEASRLTHRGSRWEDRTMGRRRQAGWLLRALLACTRWWWSGRDVFGDVRDSVRCAFVYYAPPAAPQLGGGLACCQLLANRQLRCCRRSILNVRCVQRLRTSCTTAGP